MILAIASANRVRLAIALTAILACSCSAYRVKRQAAWLAQACAEPAAYARPETLTPETLNALDAARRCQVQLILDRGSRQDLELAPCYAHGQSLEQCLREAVNGVAVGEAFYECPWTQPLGWNECLAHSPTTS